MSNNVIPESPRTEGMVSACPDYVQSSTVWAAIMNAKGLEYDRIHGMEDDLALQLSPYTATWGLVYWEQSVGLPQRLTEPYDLRRPQVLTRLQGSKNFDLEMVRAIIENYGEPATVTIDYANFVVSIVFHRGIPPYIAAIKRDIESVIHAHLGPNYTYEYTAKATVKMAAFAMVSARIIIQKQGVS